jgi:hypothetical protein
MGHLPIFSENAFSQDAALLYGVGRLVCAWGVLEHSIEDKIAVLRRAAGDVPGQGTRNKASMARLLADLRAMISMRDRRDTTALLKMAGIEQQLQRIDRFRSLIVSGFQTPEPGGFAVRDQKNNVLHISFEQLDDEIAQLEKVGEQLTAL